MTFYFYIILFLIGLGFGSFLNVVSFRFRPENQHPNSALQKRPSENKVFDLKKISGRSVCPYCQKTLCWYELIPLVSFFVQAERCRSCGHQLSWQYPLGELLSGLIFVLVPYILYPQSYILSIIWIFILSILLLISLIDFRHFFIPDELTWLLMVFGFAFIILESQVSFLRHYALLFSFSWLEDIRLNHLFAGVAASAFFGLIFYLGKGKILGEGDIKLAFALGLILGWPDIAAALLFAFLLGGLFGFILLISRRKTMKDYLPLAPFLALGVCLTAFFGYQIINGYFSLMGL
jgi:leader peptidase (prepilin peptidase)/N-methyltransferase